MLFGCGLASKDYDVEQAFTAGGLPSFTHSFDTSGSHVIEVMEPWFELARETCERVLPPIVPAGEAADAIVTFYLGVNLMTHLDPEGTRADALFARGREWAPLVAPMLTSLR